MPEPVLTNMLRLECEGQGNAIRTSRIAVLETGDDDYDFGFATGHSLPTERPCLVKDFEGRRKKVNLIRFAEGYQSGDSTDWAIIRFKKISTKTLVRYKLDTIQDLDELQTSRFYFSQAFGLPENAQSCKLSVLDFSNGRRRVIHDCRAVPGQSGSPVTRIVDGEHKLIGLHIGHLWMFESPETGRPDRKGYVNLLDENTIAQIETVIDLNRS